MNALIIDDEKDSREVIRAILEEYCPKVNIVGEADNAEDGYKLIASLSPDLLFLDIQMQPETGLDLLKKFDKYPFEVIFVTAWNQYAVEAIKLHALDYLLKPIDIDELIAAVAKAEIAVKKKTSNQRLEKMISNINLIGITMSDGIEFAPVDHIVRCEANGFYTWFYIDGSKNILATKNLKKFEEQLQQHHYFCRVHSSHLVNINYLKKYYKGESYLLMQDGSKVPVSRTYKSNFVAKLATLGVL
jgi:two-component system LytT family response regulator